MERRIDGRLGVMGMVRGNDSCEHSVIRSGVGADKGLSIGRNDNLFDTLNCESQSSTRRLTLLVLTADVAHTSLPRSVLSL